MVHIHNTKIEGCDFAFAAYRKKAEFGPAQIDVESAQLIDVKNTYLIEKGSQIKHLGKLNIGSKVFDIDSMYMSFKKVGL